MFSRGAERRRRLAPEKTPSAWSVNVKNALTIACCFVGLYFLQELLWDFDGTPSSAYGVAWKWFAICWALPILHAVFGIVGMVTFKKPSGPVGPVDKLVSFRYVSRGFNYKVLQGSIQSVYDSMEQLPLFDYVIEVVTDNPVDLSGLDRGDGRLVHMVVPTEWETPKRTLYKGRALHWAVENSTLPEDAWIMHCDEESYITQSLVAGMAQAIAEEEENGRHRIGQGIILYHRDRDDQKLLTCADSIRTGDDYARFAFQNRIGVALFGFHGSFILVRNSVAKEVGFDFGPRGSVTEDAFWGLSQMDRGRRCRFVDGYMVEQAPQTALDFIKQRRRWFVGLWLVCLFAPVRLRWRIPLWIGNLVWCFSWLGMVYTIANLFVGYPAEPVIRVLGNTVFTYYAATYIVGMRANLIDRPAGFFGSSLWYLRTILLIPYYSMLEGASVLYGIVKPDLSFHVVQKNPKRKPEAAEAGLLAPLSPLASQEGALTLFDDKRPKSSASSTEPSCLLGAYVNPTETHGEGLDVEKAKLRDFERLLGRPLAIVLRYYPWQATFGALERWDAGDGRLPLISWGSPESAPSLEEITRGEHDRLIRRRARALRAVDGPVLLRPLWEMNGSWSAWDGVHNGRDPSRYVAAWRHLKRLFAEEGADNVRFVWSPNADSHPDEEWNDAEHYYPGDDHVDWIGLDGYNWVHWEGEPFDRSFSDVFRPLYTRFAGSRPLMIAECAAAEPGKAAWVEDMARALKEEFPEVRALVWFHSDKERDWRVDSSPEALAAFKTLAADAYFSLRPEQLDDVEDREDVTADTQAEPRSPLSPALSAGRAGS